MDRYLTGTDVTAFTMVEKGRKDIAIANRFSGSKIILLIRDTPHVRLYVLNMFRMRGSRL